MADLQGASILLHGPPKVGKTQVASSFPESVQFIATEKGHRFIPEGQQKRLVYCPTGKEGWAKFLKFVGSTSIRKRKPRTIVVDTTSKLYRRCMDYTCAVKGIEHPDDAGHGKGWEALRKEFVRGLDLLMEVADDLNATVVFLEHTQQIEVNLLVEAYSKLQISMPGQCRSIVLPVPDHIWYLGYGVHRDAEQKVDKDVDLLQAVGDSRNLWISGGECIEASTRDKFVTAKCISNLPKTEQYAHIVKELYR